MLKIIAILLKKGFKEDMPTKDYESGICFSNWYKYPFTVRMSSRGVESSRVDKEYQYGYRLGEYRIKR
jgi:hypothetical protein